METFLMLALFTIMPLGIFVLLKGADMLVTWVNRRERLKEIKRERARKATEAAEKYLRK